MLNKAVARGRNIYYGLVVWVVDFSVVVVPQEPGALLSDCTVVVVSVVFSETSGLTGAPGTLGSAGAPAAPCGPDAPGAPGAPAGPGTDDVSGTVVSFTVSLQPATPIIVNKAVTAITLLAIFIFILLLIINGPLYAASRLMRVSKRSSINPRAVFNSAIRSGLDRPPV